MIFSKRRFAGWLLLTVLFMVFIYAKSAETYSRQDLRPGLAHLIPQTALERVLPHVSFYYDGDFITWNKPYDMLEFFIRKGGHLSEYAALFLLWTFTWRSWPMAKGKAVCAAAVLSVAYAATDEWHQTFVPGRTGHAIDVLMDAAGACAALLLYLIISRSRNSSGNRR